MRRVSSGVFALALCTWLAGDACAIRAAVATGDVIINEIGAATSDRLIGWSDDGIPRVGAGIPWTHLDFNDEDWALGNGGFGNVTNASIKTAPNLSGKALSLYTRRVFTVAPADAASATSLWLEVDFEEAFVAYLNGREIARMGVEAAGGFSYHDQLANSTICWTGGIATVNFTLGTASNLLVAGSNVLAVLMHKRAIYDTPWRLVPDLRLASAPSYLVQHQDQWRYFIGDREPVGGLSVPPPRPTSLPDPTLVLHTNLWRYRIGTNEPSGTATGAWAALAFNDAGWAQAPGGLGYGYPGITLVNVSNLAMSLYLRQVFTVTRDQLDASDVLRFTVSYDDGFVAYLNGRELLRANVGTNQFVPYNTVAASDAYATTTYTINNAATYLNEGANVLAIQVHNRTLANRDLLLIADMELDLVAGIDDDAEDVSEGYDWIELYNRGDTNVSLSGWALTEDPAVPDKWLFPNIILGSHRYLVVIASGLNLRSLTNKHLHTNFELSSDGEYLALLDNGSPRQVRCAFDDYPPQSFFHSFGCRDGTDDFAYLEYATPGRENLTNVTYDRILTPPTIAPDAGFYAAPLTVTITPPEMDATIRYTTNGAIPDLTRSILYTGPLVLSKSMALRARAFKQGCLPSAPATRTYLLNVTNVIKTLPAITLVGDETRDLFEPYGIMAISGGTSNWCWPEFTNVNYYNNGAESGRAYERPVSAGFIQPADNSGFQIDTGLRCTGAAGKTTRRRGNDWSTYRYKYGFRVYLRGCYGPDLLEYPLFAATWLRQFERFNIRSGFSDDCENPAVTDELMRRIFLDMGNLAAHGFHANLFINGVFKAYYNVTEEPSDRFFQDYLHTTNEFEIFRNSATTDDRTVWNQLLATVATNYSMAVHTNYLEVCKRLDIKNFADYILVNAYGGSADWNSKNNIQAREHAPGAKFTFHLWDAGSAFGYSQPVTYSIFSSNGTFAATNGSQAVFYWRLKNSPEFRLLCADRIQKHFFHGGGLTDASISNHYAVLRAAMEPMVRFVKGTYKNMIQTNWIPRRRPIVLDQFVGQGLWWSYAAPAYNQHGGHVSNGFLLTITNLNALGSIYYTLDDSDPRVAPAGTPAGTLYTGPIRLAESTTVKARAFDGAGTWSPLSEAVFHITNVYGALQITELMYNPSGGEEYEFIELKNSGALPVPLAGAWFSNGVDQTFAGNAVLGPGCFAVLVANSNAFAGRYPGVRVDGVFAGRLDNAGEQVTLLDRYGQLISAVDYKDGWYPDTDGLGYSLVPAAAGGDPNLKGSWRVSSYLFGSPGRDDPPPPPLEIVINEVLAHAAPPLEDALELYNCSSNATAIGGWYLSDSLNVLQKYRIPDGMVIPGHGYAVFYEYQFNAVPGNPACFALGARGEEVHLTSPETPPAYHTTVSFGASANGVSLGRYTTSTGAVHFVAMRRLSFGSNVTAADPPVRSNEFRAGAGAANPGPKVGPLVISEFMYHPFNDVDEFIELFNTSARNVPLYDPANPTNTWRLEDDSHVLFTFPPGLVLTAQSCLVVVGAGVHPATFSAAWHVPPETPVLGSCMYNLGNAGDAARLLMPDTPDANGVPYVLVDQIEYDDDAPWPTESDGAGPSLQRVWMAQYGNDPVNWKAGPAGGTPGSETARVNAADVEEFTATAAPATPGTIMLSWSNGTINVLACTNQSYTSDLSCWFELASAVASPWVHQDASNYPVIFYRIVSGVYTSQYDVGKYTVTLAPGASGNPAYNWIAPPLELFSNTVNDVLGNQLNYDEIHFDVLQAQIPIGGAQIDNYYVGGIWTDGGDEATRFATGQGYILVVDATHTAAKTVAFVGKVPAGAVTNMLSAPRGGNPAYNWIGTPTPALREFFANGLTNAVVTTETAQNFDVYQNQVMIGGAQKDWYYVGGQWDDGEAGTPLQTPGMGGMLVLDQNHINADTNWFAPKTL